MGAAEEKRERDQRFGAALDLIKRTGALAVQIRYSDDEEPTVWFVVAEYEREGKKLHETAAAMNPFTAAMRLVDQLVDGAECVHCHKPIHDLNPTPLDDLFCWYVYDPELKKFRRSCEGN